MSIRNLILSSLLIIVSFSLKAQVTTNNILSVFEEYGLILDENLNKNAHYILIKLNKPLTKKKIDGFKPLRIFSATEFVISGENLPENENDIIYKKSLNSFWKASDQLIKTFEGNIKSKKPFIIRLIINQLKSIPPYLKNFKIIKIDYPNDLIFLEIMSSDLLSILNHPAIIYADIDQKAKEEIVINGLDLGMDEITSAQTAFPQINGKDIVLSVKEGMFDETDIDLVGRIVAKQTGDQTGHATLMSTLALGNGNSFIKGLGVAPFAKLASSSFINLMPDDLNQLKVLGVSVQNHSYGTDINNIYGIEATAYDKQLFEADTILHVFSAGNKGTFTSVSGIYKGIANFSNLTGNFKQAKNTLVVGGINKENKVEELSSKGPAYDGRVKPDIVAMGEDGTSGAAAISTGVVALLQQKYHSQFNKMPSSALIRSVLVNSADDLGTTNVDYTSGFGKLNALNALKTIDENKFITAEVQSQQDYTLQIVVPTAQKEVKVSLVWNDPAAVINSAQSIVNHLDLSLETPSGQIILPWVLNSYPHIDSLLKPAERKRDDLNTVQQVSLGEVTPGVYTIHVKARTLNQPKQAFAMAYQFKTMDAFEFTYPQNELFASEDNYIRWNASYDTNQIGQLSVSFNDGASWQTIASGVILANDFFKWNTPNLFGKAILKMQVGAKSYLSKSFAISKPLTLKVGFNCSDRVLVYWPKQAEANNYTVYHIKNNVLTALVTLTDTILSINKKDLASTYLAVNANGPNFSGLKSYTIDYTQQGLSCYQQSFSGVVVNSQIKLDLAIGSTYNLKRIVWEKQTGLNTYSSIKTQDIERDTLHYTLMDVNPKKGVQRYRVTFETIDGLKFTSDIIALDFLKEDEFLYYPNPVTQYLTISPGSFEQYDFELYNMLGARIIKEKGNGTQQFDFNKCLPGLYIAVISRNGVVLQKMKIIKI